jgi:hypothetical protein
MVLRRRVIFKGILRVCLGSRDSAPPHKMGLRKTPQGGTPLHSARLRPHNLAVTRLRLKNEATLFPSPPRPTRWDSVKLRKAGLRGATQSGTAREKRPPQFLLMQKRREGRRRGLPRKPRLRKASRCATTLRFDATLRGKSEMRKGDVDFLGATLPHFLSF